MSANVTSIRIGPEMDSEQSEAQGILNCSTPTGCYRELSPAEFRAMKSLRVVMLKTTDSPAKFSGYVEVVSVACSQELQPHLHRWSPGEAIGLVCPDGECSSRLAIRLSREGHAVYHLAGGLREWTQVYRD